MSFLLDEVANDPDLGQQTVTILRSQGKPGPGGWVNHQTSIVVNGVVGIADSKALQQFPEADRVVGSIIFVSPVPIYATSEAREGLSDKVLWNGNEYRVKSVGQWGPLGFGFWGALLDRMTGS